MTLRFNGSSSGYVEIAAPASPTNNTLTLPTGNGTSGQYLQSDGTGALSWQDVTTVNGLAYPSAGPLSNRNKIINGDMRIDQRNAGAAVTSSTAYPVDRWITYNATDGAYSGQQSTDVPTGTGFLNSLKYTITTADSSIGATQYAAIVQKIEGYNVADLKLGTANARQFIVSFWVRSSVTGTYGFALKNGANNRAYATTYGINSANTWEYKTLTITGDTTGTWSSDNSTGIDLSWGLGVGSTYTVSANDAWEDGLKFGAVGSTNLFATNGATFYITGVQLEVGSVATPFEHRSYGDELARCQRYYQKLQSTLGDTIVYTGYNASSAVSRGTIYLPVSMRTSPTAVETTGTASDYNIRSGGSTTTCSSVPSFEHANLQSIGIQFNVSSGLTSDAVSLCRFANTNAFLAWGAEL
jgi:hypothetical protein